MYKDFDDWNKIKKYLDKEHNPPTFKQGEIWWCSIGLNVGDEENGKGTKYNRPILVVRKYNNRLFLGLPLTTQIKENPYYKKIHFKDKEQCVMLSQVKTWDSKRMTHKLGKLTSNQLENVKRSLKEMI